MIQPFIASNTSIPIPLLCRTEIPKKKKKNSIQCRLVSRLCLC